MNPLHSWDVSVEEAAKIQDELRGRIVIQNRFSTLRTVGGADVAYSKKGNRLFGAIAVFSFPQLEWIDSTTVHGAISFPYLPGLFSFREGPILLEAFHHLKVKPDLLLFDGHGIAHPKRFGLASHLGLWLDLPTIGCARTSLLGNEKPSGPSKGDFTWVYQDGEKVGAVLRTRELVKPVFVSPGHRIDLPTSIEIVLATCLHSRIPEPLRIAHHLSQCRRLEWKEGS